VDAQDIVKKQRKVAFFNALGVKKYIATPSKGSVDGG